MGRAEFGFVDGQFMKREFLPIPRVRVNDSRRSASVERDLGLGTSAEEDSTESSLSKKNRRRTRGSPNTIPHYDNKAYQRDRNYP